MFGAAQNPGMVPSWMNAPGRAADAPGPMHEAGRTLDLLFVRNCWRV